MLPTFLLPLNLSNQPAYSFLNVFTSNSFSSYPSFINVLMAYTIFYFVFFIYFDFFAFGLVMNSLIRSIGRANNPTPPNITKNIQPKNDMIAIIYTASDVSRVIVLDEVAGLGIVA